MAMAQMQVSVTFNAGIASWQPGLKEERLWAEV